MKKYGVRKVIPRLTYSRMKTLTDKQLLDFIVHCPSDTSRGIKYAVLFEIKRRAENPFKNMENY